MGTIVRKTGPMLSRTRVACEAKMMMILVEAKEGGA
jgi:hypothetical protein